MASHTHNAYCIYKSYHIYIINIYDTYISKGTHLCLALKRGSPLKSVEKIKLIDSLGLSHTFVCTRYNVRCCRIKRTLEAVPTSRELQI